MPLRRLSPTALMTTALAAAFFGSAGALWWPARHLHTPPSAARAPAEPASTRLPATEPVRTSYKAPRG